MSNTTANSIASLANVDPSIVIILGKIQGNLYIIAAVPKGMIMAIARASHLFSLIFKTFRDTRYRTTASENLPNIQYFMFKSIEISCAKDWLTNRYA